MKSMTRPASLSLAFLLAILGSASVFAAKSSSDSDTTPWLEGPIVNPDSGLVASATTNPMIYYGDDVGFIPHNVLLTTKETAYVGMICVQGDVAVYNGSLSGPDMLVFTMEDPVGQGLDWVPGIPANCNAALLVNETKGKNTTIRVLSVISFVVL